MNTTTSIKPGRYHIYVEGESGERFDERKGTNLILDNFLNRMATENPLSIIASAFAGDGKPSPTATMYTYSDTITASQSGTTITASAPFFNSGMVGKGIHFETDTTDTYNCKIVSFTSTTEVEVNTTNTVASDSFAIWNTDMIELNNDISMGFDARQTVTSSITNESLPDAIVMNYSLRYNFARRDYNAESPIVVNEIGLGTASNNLGIMFYLDSDVSIPANFRLVVNYELSVVIGGIKSVAPITLSGSSASFANANSFITNANDGGGITPKHATKGVNLTSIEGFIFPWFAGTYYVAAAAENLTYSLALKTIPTNFTLATYLNTSFAPQQWVKTYTTTAAWTGGIYTLRNIVVREGTLLSSTINYRYDTGTNVAVTSPEDSLSITFTWTWTRSLPAISSL
jgi:hypothetical protein